MEHLETTTLEAYWHDVQKFNKRRQELWFQQRDRRIVVYFHRIGNSILCELQRDILDRGLYEPLRLGTGISHKSHRCEGCGRPGDRWNEALGKTLALWSAMRDYLETSRGKHPGREG